MIDNKFARVAVVTTISAVGAGTLFAHEAFAEGSKDLVINGGNRPFLEWDAGNFTAGIERKTVLYAYAKAGETIMLGSSVSDTKDNGDIIITMPDQTVRKLDVTKSAGYIDSVTEEKNGPNFGKVTNGYTPIKVEAAQEGWYQIEFHPSPNGIANTDPIATAFDAKFLTSQNRKTIAAWDITIADRSGSEKTGRVYANYLALNMGGNEKELNSKLYILTKDGYQYLTDMNGIDPFGFIFFSNNRGFIDNTGKTLYHSVAYSNSTGQLDGGNAKILNPSGPDTETDVTHRIFFNKPSSDLPSDVPIHAEAPPVPSGFSFKAAAGSHIAYIGEGGQFEFSMPKKATYQLIIDTNKDGSFDPTADLVLENVSKAGSNTVSWNGKDQNGNNLPVGDYKVKLMAKGGEYHFPMLDVENAPEGIKIELQNQPYAFPAGLKPTTIYYDDSRLTGPGATNPISALKGIDSATGVRGFTNDFGNNRAIDTWTYFPGQAIETTLSIVDSRLLGKVFVDANYNKVNDSEAGMAGVKVDVKDASGNVLQTVITDTSGNYSVNLKPGNYQIEVDRSSQALQNYRLTTANNPCSVAIQPGNTAHLSTGFSLNRVPDANNVSVSIVSNETASGKLTGTDPDGDSLTYSKAASPANGTAVVLPDGSWTYTPNPGFTGADHFTVVADDGNGGKDTVTITVTVANRRPSLTGQSKETNQGMPVGGTLEGMDPDGQVLSYSIKEGPAGGQAVIDSRTGEWTYTPSGHYAGQDEFTVVVTDPYGLSAEAAVQIRVNNIAPIGQNQTINTVQNEAVSGTAAAADAPGEPLTFSKGTNPANGTVSVDEAGRWTYTPNDGFAGTDHFTVEVTDEHGGRGSLTVTVQVANIVPIGEDLRKVTQQNKTIEDTMTAVDVKGDVLKYRKGTDPENGQLDVTAAGRWSYRPNDGFVGEDSFTVVVEDQYGGTDEITVTVVVHNLAPVGNDVEKETVQNKSLTGKISADDVDGDSLEFSLGENKPLNGKVEVEEDGRWTYTPNAGFAGEDSFTVVVKDQHGGTDEVTVSVLVKNLNPVGNDLEVETMQNVAIDGQATAKDVPGDGLTFSQGEDGPENGTVVVKEDGRWTYTPTQGFVGEDSFEVVVKDGYNGTDTIKVRITVRNQNPVVVAADISKSTNQNTPAAGKVDAADPDGDKLTYGLGDGPAHGTVDVDSETGEWTYTPDEHYVGGDRFTVVVTDAHGGTVEGTVHMEVLNQGPAAEGEERATFQDAAVTGQIKGTDPDGDTLRYSLGTVSPAHGSVVIASETGKWTYTPDDDFVGTDEFTVYVTDPHGLKAEARVVVTVINHPPEGQDQEGVTFQNSPVSGTASAADLDHDTLTYAIGTTGPANGRVEVMQDGSWTYTPNEGYVGKDSFTIVVTDNHGGTDTITITVKVKNQAPVGEGQSKETDQNVPVGGKVSATDVAGDHVTFAKGEIGPAHGTVEVSEDGSWTYTPNEGYVGEDSFTIVVTDNHGGTDTITITVKVKNLAPVGEGQSKETDQNVPVGGKVSATDVAGDHVTFAKGESGPAHGTVEVMEDGSWTYMPSNGYVGEDSFKIVVTDNHGGTDTINVTVKLKNLAPVGEGQSKETDQNVPVGGKVSAMDVAGDSVTFAKGESGPAHGTVEVSEDGSWTYTPSNGYVGEDSFMIVVTDSHGGTDTITVTVKVKNLAPVGEGQSKETDQNVPVGGKVSATDVAGDQVTFTKGESGPAHGTVEVMEDGSWTYTPSKGYVGEDSFMIVVTDSHGGTDTIMVTVKVKNQAPVGEDQSKETDQNVPVG
ncbi:Ig-like domain-containing protein, partial [Neobacillus muris]|uniref:Ig-like domain-containing protein n=1 Tax=Neobacillus muris TaxID=2941334 RepID=UPI00203D7911